jgi:hypothetical protein
MRFVLLLNAYVLFCSRQPSCGCKVYKGIYLRVCQLSALLSALMLELPVSVLCPKPASNGVSYRLTPSATSGVTWDNIVTITLRLFQFSAIHNIEHSAEVDIPYSYSVRDNSSPASVTEVSSQLLFTSKQILEILVPEQSMFLHTHLDVCFSLVARSCFAFEFSQGSHPHYCIHLLNEHCNTVFVTRNWDSNLS